MLLSADSALKKLVGIIGSGNIGRDPYDKGSWSGSSRFFFTACSKAGILERAIGVEVPTYLRIPRILENFAFNGAVWREKFYLDSGYYRDLTRTIEKMILPGDYQHNFIQIGAIYDVSGIVNGRSRCYSYHDGNLAQSVISPYFNKKIPNGLVDRALAYERQIYHGLDKIFTMSEYLRKSFIEDFDIPPIKVVNIGAGINLDTIPPSLPEKDYSHKQVLFVGVDFYRKGGLQLLQAFQIVRQTLPQASLTIVGPRNLRVDANLANGVRFLGFLNKGDSAQRNFFEETLKQSSLFVLPSLYEPFGIAPLEAMVHEIPCLLTNRWAFPEMVSPGENGELVECGNVGELAEKMTALLNDPGRLCSMGKRGRGIVLQEFTWEKVVERLSGEIE